MIYFDNAATTMAKPPAVAQAVADALSSFGGVGRGAHPASLAAGMAVYEAREGISDLLGAPGPERVSFSANATASLNMAVAGLLPPGGKAVTTAASHNSVLRPLFKARDERGARIEVVPVDERGSLDYDALDRAVEGAQLVIVTHASNVTGDGYDVGRIARAAHKAGALVVVDAAQTAGVIPLSMAEFGADALVFTGHKGLLGPQGTGGLCLAEGVDIPPLLEGGSGTHSFDERHPRTAPEALEAGTPNAHGLAGLAAGVAWLRERGVEAVAAREAQLVERFCAGAAAIGGVRLLGGGGDGRPAGIVALNIGSLDAGYVADRLACDWGICTRAGAHCAPLMHKALGTEDQGAVRVSFGPFNTEGEVDTCLDALATIAREDL